MTGITPIPQLLLSLIRISALLLITAVLGACGTLYKLEINAMNSGQSDPHGKYVLLPSDEKTPESDPEFQKYAAMVERGLSEHSLNRLPVERIAESDIAIVVGFGVDDPEIIGTTSKVPMFQTQSSSEAEDGPGESGPRSGGQQGASAPTGVVDAPPTQKLLGTQEYTFVRTVYWRDLSLRAVPVENRSLSDLDRQITRSVWAVSVESLGTSTDLDEVLPVLVVAAMPYVGANLTEPALEKINGTDRRIKAIAGTK
jgi:hypothetical protein